MVNNYEITHSKYSSRIKLKTSCGDGHFSISYPTKKSKYANIHIGLNKNIRKKGYSKVMVRKLLNNLKNYNHPQKLYINVNSSNGFWNSIKGITQLNYRHPMNKSITYKKLHNWSTRTQVPNGFWN